MIQQKVSHYACVAPSLSSCSISNAIFHRIPKKTPEIIQKTICRSADQQNWLKKLNSLTTDTLVREMLAYEVNHPCEFHTVTCSSNIWLENYKKKLRRLHCHQVFTQNNKNTTTIEIWLILPVVICLFQGLSHACLRITALQESAHGSLHQT